MFDTSLSLLERLRNEPDAEAWQRLVQMYTPLIRRWLQRSALPEADCEDLTQDVMAVLVRRLPEFEHNQRPGAFRSWLRLIVTHRLRDFWRGQHTRPQAPGGSDFVRLLEELEDPGSGLTRLWDLEHDRHVVDKVLEQIEPQFEATTWTAFQRVARDNLRPADVAAELGISVNAVLLAKSRVLRELRRACQDLVD